MSRFIYEDQIQPASFATNSNLFSVFPPVVLCYASYVRIKLVIMWSSAVLSKQDLFLISTVKKQVKWSQRTTSHDKYSVMFHVGGTLSCENPDKGIQYN